MIPEAIELSMLDEMDEIIKIAAQVGQKDDDDEGPPQTEGLSVDHGKKACVECGKEIDEDDQHCKKCGSRQVIPRKAPRGAKAAPPKEDEEDEFEENGGTGGKKSADQQELDMSKVSFKFVSRNIKAGKPRNLYNAAFGTGVVGAGVYGAHKANQFSKPKPQEDPRYRRQPGMVRTAAAKRGLNPAHRIRKGKKLKVLRAFLGRSLK